MRRVPLTVIIAPLLWLLACQRDPGRDVKPISDPLRPGVLASTASTEIIPLDKLSKSQAAAVSQRIANTEITLTYSRPLARGRLLFGGIVPYDQVWNPGAERATAISVTRDVQINGQPLQAASSFSTIPRPETWTVIFSKAANVYHTPYPDEDQDQLRVAVRPERGAHMETLLFYFPIVEGKDAVLRLHWGETMVPLSIRVP